PRFTRAVGSSRPSTFDPGGDRRSPGALPGLRRLSNDTDQDFGLDGSSASACSRNRFTAAVRALVAVSSPGPFTSVRSAAAIAAQYDSDFSSALTSRT